jgi:hypothetical protein
MYSSLVGLILPPFIDFINKNIANSKVRFVVSLVVCSFVALALEFMNGTLKYANGQEILQSIALIFTSSQVIYKLYWEKSTMREVVFKK